MKRKRSNRPTRRFQITAHEYFWSGNVVNMILAWNNKLERVVNYSNYCKTLFKMTESQKVTYPEGYYGFSGLKPTHDWKKVERF